MLYSSGPIRLISSPRTLKPLGTMMISPRLMPPVRSARLSREGPVRHGCHASGCNGDLLPAFLRRKIIRPENGENQKKRYECIDVFQISILKIFKAVINDR
jgi:hypothetical protein